MQMQIKTLRWKRTIKLESWSKEDDKSFMKILYPKRDKGITILILESAIIGGWISWYLELNPIYLESLEDAMEQYGDYGYVVEPIIPALFSLSTVFYSMAFVFIVNIVAILYPIFKINSLKPVDAINRIWVIIYKINYIKFK